MPKEITRRDTLAMGLAAGTLSLAGCAGARGMAAAGAASVPLPDAETIRREYQQMVDFGARLPGNPAHQRYVASMVRDFRQIGLTIGPCEDYPFERWDPLAFGLDVAEEGGFRAVSDVAYYVRSASTGPAGISGPLHYGGRITAEDPMDEGTIEGDLAAVPQGAIVVLDAQLPVTNVRELVDPGYLHVPPGEREDYLQRPYKRLWRTPGYRLEALRDAGAAGVVIVMDVSSDMIRNNFSPHSRSYRPPLPAHFVGQDTGEALRRDARARREARLVLHAEWVECMVPQITAILPGESDETIIVNTHTDGQNFIEENGCVALIQLARHFASLPPGERLRRTLVFAAWPGHMSGTMPECEGWIRAHPDLVDRAIAALTLEHFGAPEWEDVPGQGYAATGRNEYMNFATTAGPLTDMVEAGLRRYELSNHGIERAPGTTTGAAFHSSGVPHVGAICGPNYLLGIVENGHMDKLDADLAARQTRMMADIIREVDAAPAAHLRAADPSLGAAPVTGQSSALAARCSSL